MKPRGLNFKQFENKARRLMQFSKKYLISNERQPTEASAGAGVL